MTTIVSAFVANVNNNRDINDYINYGLTFMLTPIHKIVFMDATIIHHFADVNNQYLHIIPTTFEDCYLYQQMEQIIKFNNLGNSKKDTLKYMFIMNNKLDFQLR